MVHSHAKNSITFFLVAIGLRKWVECVFSSLIWEARGGGVSEGAYFIE